MVVDLEGIENLRGAAWMGQHTAIRKKPLYIRVFATPTASKATSNKQTKNSYFRHLQNQKFCSNLPTVPKRMGILYFNNLIFI